MDPLPWHCLIVNEGGTLMRHQIEIKAKGKFQPQRSPLYVSPHCQHNSRPFKRHP